jgi:hypothetical protein
VRIFVSQHKGEIPRRQHVLALQQLRRDLEYASPWRCAAAEAISLNVYPSVELALRGFSRTVAALTMVCWSPMLDLLLQLS